ncbi:MAG: bifunctional shikimate kinase/3-dehydroquinate synthase [Candidatus Limnocylindrales bacterium]
MDVVLVGLSGSGKSAVGRRLASRHAATFIDLDELVERQVGKSVPDIFAKEGEPGFRRYEREAVLSLGPADPDPVLRRVIATGGGAVIDPRNRWLLYRDRFPVWLDGSPEVLASRLGRSSNVRPLVAGTDAVATLRRLGEDRRRFYAPALQISGAANLEAVLRAIEGHLGDVRRGSVTVLRADTAIGDVEIGCGNAAEAVASALTRAEARRAILLAEPRTWEVAGSGIAAALSAAGWKVERILLPRGEDAKRMNVVEETCRALARLHVDRRETLVAIGGGALTDAAGFAAATYLRGVAIVHVPTTLVGQIDAALGGKTAVDIPEGKNLIGAFHQPVAFIADVSFIATLPARERQAALGEVVKMAVLGDERLLELVEEDGEAIARGDVEAIESGAVAEMVERCAWAKVEVVTADAREANVRMTLNLGHTIGHGIEAAAGYSSILHGEAVAYGLRGAFAIATAMGLTTIERAARVNRLLDRLGLAVEPPAVSREQVLEHVATDKKHVLGRLNWVLPTESGVVVRSDVPPEAVEAGLAAALRVGSRHPAGPSVPVRSEAGVE